MQDLQAVGVGQHDVEKHRVGHALGAGPPKGGVVGQALGLDARLRKRVDGELADVLLVLDVVDHAVVPLLSRLHGKAPYSP